MIISYILFLLMISCYSWADEENDYDKVFDVEIDVDDILDNDRILDSYLKCFYSTGPCSKLGENVKAKITEIFSTVCGACSEKQKDMLHHTLRKFVPMRPNDWEKLLSIYDPKSEFRGGIEEFMKSERGGA